MLDYNYFKKRYKMILETLLDADSKAIQHINFTGNLKEQSTRFFIIKQAKETVLDFPQGTVKVF